MQKISQRYLDQACHIREIFLSLMDQIIKKEKEIDIHKSEIKRLMEINKDYVEKNKTKSVEQAKEDLKEELYAIDDRINKICNTLNPLLEQVSKLEQEAKDLYSSIKNKYPKLSEVEIQEQVFKSLKR